MDLIWQRQVELWLRLLGQQTYAAAPCLTLSFPGDERLHLEALAGRALLSVSRPLDARLTSTVLPSLLRLLPPEAAGGLPVRAWIAQQRLWVAATMPQDSDAQFWYAQTRGLQRLLLRALKAEHGDAE